jgi:hypothetical protein
MMHGGHRREELIDEANVWMDMRMLGFRRWAEMFIRLILHPMQML